MVQLRRASGESGEVHRWCHLHRQHLTLVHFFPLFRFELLLVHGWERERVFAFCGWLGEDSQWRAEHAGGRLDLAKRCGGVALCQYTQG